MDSLDALDQFEAETSEPVTEAVASGPMVFLEQETPTYVDTLVAEKAQVLAKDIKADTTAQALATAMIRRVLEGWADEHELPHIAVKVRQVKEAAALAIEVLRDAGLEDLLANQPSGLEAEGWTLSLTRGGTAASIKDLPKHAEKLTDEEAAKLAEYQQAQASAEALRKELNLVAKRVGAVTHRRDSLAFTPPKRPDK